MLSDVGRLPWRSGNRAKQDESARAIFDEGGGGGGEEDGGRTRVLDPDVSDVLSREVGDVGRDLSELRDELVMDDEHSELGRRKGSRLLGRERGGQLGDVLLQLSHSVGQSLPAAQAEERKEGRGNDASTHVQE